jgi:hypothetical protein
MSQALRFDESTGTLIGSPLLPVPDFIAAARDAGMRFRPMSGHEPETRCGCALEVAAWLRGITGESTPRLAERLGLDRYTAFRIGFSFDEGLPSDDRGLPYPDECEPLPSSSYGVAVRKAAEAAGLMADS